MFIKRIEYLIKHNKVIQKSYVIIMSFIFKVLGLFLKTNSHQIMFQSMIGKVYGDSPKVLFDSIRNDPAFTGYDFVGRLKSRKSFRWKKGER